jgi:hypothetical protein
MATETYSLSVLRCLEAESIHILREVVAEFAERTVNAPYELPTDSDLVLDTADLPLERCVDALLAALLARIAPRMASAPD